MEVSITILNDNICGPPSFKGEHGLSLLVSVEGRRFLWDCGASEITVQNARMLGIDLGEIEGIGISHGHFDHTGGLLSVMQAAGPKQVYMHPAALEPKFALLGSMRKFIGIPVRREVMETVSAGLVLSAESVEVMPGVSTTGEVARVTDFEAEPEPYLFHQVDGELVLDSIIDDQALVVDTPDGAVLVTGCAHAGLVNTCRAVLQKHERIKAIVGGTHLGLGAPESKVEPTLDFLEELAPERVVACHCTGTPVICRMKERLADRMVFAHTGLVLQV